MKTRSLFYFCLVLALAAGPSCSRQTPEQTDEQTAARPTKEAPAQPSNPSKPPTSEPQTSAESTPSESPSAGSTSEELSADDLPDPFNPGNESDGVQLIEPGTDLPPTKPQGAESPAVVQDENANENLENQDESVTQAEPAKPKTVWLDNDKRVVMKAEVVLREGFLEMLVCLKGTKEHESILAVDTKAALVHTQLLLAGAEKGEPVQYLPEYHPATGQEIDIQLEWKDESGKLHRARAQEWIKNSDTGNELEHPWVFAGSQFAPDGFYLAESGDLICVANFPSATLDLPVQSTDSDTQLLFAAFTERIPPVGTEVTVYLTPVKADNEEEASEPQP